MTPSHQCLDKTVTIARHRDRNPGGLTDGMMLSNKDVEHDAVDSVVGAVVGDGSDDVLGLSVAVDAPFTLFVTRRVPGEVVMDDRVEVVLEVDTFGETVGGNQDAWSRRLSEVVNPALTFLGREGTRDRLYCHRVGQRLAELFGDIFGRRDEPAEDDWVVVLFEQLLDHLDQPGKLGVVFRTGELLGISSKVPEASTRLGGVSFDLGDVATRDHVDTFQRLLIGEVQDGASTQLVYLLGGVGLERCRTISESGGGSSRAGGESTE